MDGCPSYRVSERVVHFSADPPARPELSLPVPKIPHPDLRVYRAPSSAGKLPAGPEKQSRAQIDAVEAAYSCSTAMSKGDDARGAAAPTPRARADDFELAGADSTSDILRGRGRAAGVARRRRRRSERALAGERVPIRNEDADPARAPIASRRSPPSARSGRTTPTTRRPLRSALRPLQRRARRLLRAEDFRAATKENTAQVGRGEGAPREVAGVGEGRSSSTCRTDVRPHREDAPRARP